MVKTKKFREPGEGRRTALPCRHEPVAICLTVVSTWFIQRSTISSLVTGLYYCVIIVGTRKCSIFMYKNH